MTIDYIASQPHYLAHITPVWHELPAEAKSWQFGSANSVLVASFGDVGKARKAGYQRIALLEHGIGQSYGNSASAYPGGKYRDAVDLFLSPNETAASRDRAAYPKARVEVVGCPKLPKLDTLPARVPDGQTTVAISFHWGSDLAPELRSTFPYYRVVLPELARSFHVIGHAHPRIARKMERQYAKLGIEFVGSFEDVCRQADVYVCDNSSTLYEFASTGRPVVVLNAPWYRRDVELGLRFWAAQYVGFNVSDPSELLDRVAAAVRDDSIFHPAREAALNIVYQPRSGGAALAVSAILDWLADQAVAA